VPLYVHFLAGGVTPDNTPHGYNLTYAFPMILFIVIAAVLYVVLFQRPHNRVPPRRFTFSAGASAAPGAASAAGPAAGNGSSGTNGKDTATPSQEAGE
jgi:hypothetical protein